MPLTLRVKSAHKLGTMKQDDQDESKEVGELNLTNVERRGLITEEPSNARVTDKGFARRQVKTLDNTVDISTSINETRKWNKTIGRAQSLCLSSATS